MKQPFFVACSALTLAGTMTLAAQTPPPPSTARPQPPGATQPMPRTDQATLTVTGCLKPWDNAMGTMPAEPAAKPGTTPMPGARYVLTATEPKQAVAQPGTPAPATPPATTTPPAHPRSSQFIVTAGTGVNLAAHVNHMVSVTGTVEGTGPTEGAADKPAARPGDPAPAPTPGMAAADKAGDHKWAKLTATSVTMVSATCTTQSQ